MAWFKMPAVKTCLGGATLLAALSSMGCQSDYAGQTLPSAYWLTDDIQYFPPGPEFKLSREAAALKAQGTGRINRPAGGPLGPAEIPPAPAGNLPGGPVPGPVAPADAAPGADVPPAGVPGDMPAEDVIPPAEAPAADNPFDNP